MRLLARVVVFSVGIVLGLLISCCIRYLAHPMTWCRLRPSAIVVPGMSYAPAQAPITEIVEVRNKDNCDILLDKECTNLSTKLEKTDKTQQRKLLFVGVMTAVTFLETRAKAVWETWAKDVEGKVVFFVGGIDYDEGVKYGRIPNHSLPLVPLPDVDDSYPPQKKSFMMLRYMHQNYGDEYEWFFRADDDVYVRLDKLSTLLRSIDSRHLYFIGQAGRGNRVEKGTLNLGANENFCMGGPGIAFSWKTLTKVAPNVQQCLKGMFSTHEDVELGRCVQRFAGISCTWAYEMQTIFHHNSSGELAFTGNLKRREVHKAITLHPVKDMRHLYRLHAYFKGLQIQDLLYEQISITRQFQSITEYVSPNVTNAFQNDFQNWEETGLLPTLNKYTPARVEDVKAWDFLGKGIYSKDSLSPKSKLRKDTKEGLEDVVRDVMEIINGQSHARGRVVDFKEILYGYRRINPMYGTEYILDLLLTYRKYRGRKMTIPVRRHVYLQRPLGPLQIRIVHSESHSTPEQRPRTNIVMIVPLAGRYDTFSRFLDSFTATCIDLYSDLSRTTLFNLNLVVVFFGKDNEKERFLLLVKRNRGTLGQLRNNQVCQIKMVQIDDEFSRGVALETGISQCEDDDLLFLIDVDLIFTPSVVERVYLNTRQGVQVYFPVVFSQYDPKIMVVDGGGGWNCTLLQSGSKRGKEPSSCPLTPDVGYWREFGYGIASFYKSDFKQAGGYDRSIKGWGKEDVALFDKFLRHTNLTIFRAADPELIHGFHETECDTSLSHEQLKMCLGSQATTLGSQVTLMKYLFKSKNANVK